MYTSIVKHWYHKKKFKKHVGWHVLLINLNQKSDYIRYDVSSDDTGLIIFSEIFYPKGWKAYINDQEVTMERFNYILRGLEVPKGKHRLEFVFDPTIVKLSSNISLFSTLGFVFLILVMILKRKNWKGYWLYPIIGHHQEDQVFNAGWNL